MAHVNRHTGKVLGTQNAFLWILEPSSGVMKTHDFKKTGFVG